MGPTSVLSAVALGVAGFLATSGDNLVILLGLYGSHEYRPRAILVGYVGAIGAVVVAGRLFAILAHRAPAGLIGYLGVVPLALGIHRLVALLRHGDRAATPSGGPPAAWSGAPAIALITLAASSDSLVTFAAILADTRPPLGLIVLTTVVGSASLLAIGARHLVQHTALGDRIRRAAPFVLPFLLIAIGLFILADTPTDVVGAMPRVSSRAVP